jgi:hypothetical protein
VNANYLQLGQSICHRALPQITEEITQEIYYYLPLLSAFKLVNRAACNLHMQIDIMVMEATEQEQRVQRDPQQSQHQSKSELTHVHCFYAVQNQLVDIIVYLIKVHEKSCIFFNMYAVYAPPCQMSNPLGMSKQKNQII